MATLRGLRAMGKEKRREKGGKIADDTPPVAASTAIPPGAPDPAPPPPPPTPRNFSSRLRDLLPQGGMLPWWVMLLVAVYTLVKLGMTLEHPCGVLGIGNHAPITRAQISRAFRTLSTCTHPDKLVGHSAEQIRRGELLFKRASDAKDQLITTGADNGCDTQLDAAIYQTVLFIVGWLYETGGVSIATTIFNFFYDLLTFQNDITTTISCLLLSMSVFSTLRNLLNYIFQTGPITALLSIVTYTFIGPLPTLYRLAILPPLRFSCFVRRELLPFLRGVDDEETPLRFQNASPADDGGEAPLGGGEGVSTEDANKEESCEMEGAVGGKGEEVEGAAGSGRVRLPQANADAPKRGLRQRKGAAQPNNAKPPPPGAHGTHEGQPEIPPELRAVLVEAMRPVGPMPLREIIERKSPPDFRLASAVS